MKPLVSGNLKIALVLIGYAITCLVIMSVLFHKEWKIAQHYRRRAK